MRVVPLVCLIAVACPSCASDPQLPGPDAGNDPLDPPACVREDMREWYADADGDGFGDPEAAQLACEQPDGFVGNADDCNDDAAESLPGGIEICDGLDNDCDAATEDPCATGCAAYRGPQGVYALCLVQASHQNSAALCDTMDMKLARVDSLEEHDSLRAEMTARLGNAGNYWIGGTDSIVENEWRWPDGIQFWQGRSGGSVVANAFVQWDGGEPNNNDGEDCLEVRNDAWNDQDCGNGRFSVCERY